MEVNDRDCFPVFHFGSITSRWKNASERWLRFLSNDFVMLYLNICKDATGHILNPNFLKEKMIAWNCTH